MALDDLGAEVGRGVTIMGVLTADSSYTRKKPTQHCKAIAFQLKRNLKITHVKVLLLTKLPVNNSLYFNTTYSITSNCMVKTGF